MPDTPTVVVVDDAPDVRVLVRTRLRVSGRFDVVGEGADGEQAVELAARLRPAVLLLDVSMPRTDGLAALPRVLAASPETRVVMFTGFEEGALVDRALELGAAAFVEKSAPVDLLVERLLDVVGEGQAGRDLLEPGDGASLRLRTDRLADRGVLDDHLERFRAVFDQAAIGMATMTLTGAVVRANPALARLLDVDEAALVGTSYADLVGDRAAEVTAALQRLLTEPGDLEQVEHGMPGPDRRRLLATLSPVRDSGGRPLYFFLQVQDVTAERAATEALRQSEERFRLLVDAVEDYAIFMLDPDGRVASWNAGAERNKGYTADEVIGRHFSIFYPPEVVASGHCERELEEALRVGQYEEEGWRIRKDGSRFWASVLLTAVFGPDGTHLGFTKVTRDTTERRRLEQEREQALTALADANAELEALNDRLRAAVDDQAQFLAVTAHELRTPVGVLAGSAEVLSQHWEELDGPERKELLDAMGSSTVRLRRLLDDLLTASRLQASALTLRKDRVSVSDLLSGAVANARQAHPEAGVTTDADGDLRVVGDRERLAQVLDNLVANAVRHGVPPVRVAARRRGDTVELRVSDAGPGVAPEVRPRLFERFSTGAHKGTGLGLYIVREIARAHGGDATYETGPDGAGGAFVVTLPAAVGE